MDDIARKQKSPRAPRSPHAAAAASPLGRAPWESPRLLLTVLATVLAFPALLLIPRHGPSSAEAVATGGRPAASGLSKSAAPRSSAQTSPKRASALATAPPATVWTPAAESSTSEAATTEPPTTEWTAPSTAAWVPPTTEWTPPTTAWTPPPTTAPPVTAPPAPANSESGEASWYDWRPGECAHKTIPKGTVVTIHASNGATATCVVTDRGPFGAGRIIDLDRGVFAQLTSPGTGVIAVTITW